MYVLSNHSYLVYTIDVSVILSVVLPRQTGEVRGG